MSELKAALQAVGITVKKYDPEKTRPVYTDKNSLSVGKFIEVVVSALGAKIIEHPAIAKCIGNATEMEKLLEAYAESEGISNGQEGHVYVPQELSHLTLNVDRSSREPGAKRFFCTTPEEIVDPNFSGAYYIDSLMITAQEAVRLARPVVPRYMPRKGPGVHPEFDESTNSTVPYFNTYIPSRWERWRRRNPRAWARLPAKPPRDLMALLKHVVPLREEREYLYAWIYTSLTHRAYVYPIFCGPPGLGKNRIKLLMRALHGERNSVDGKKETLGANQSRFNSQLENSTLIWFDELEMTREMESRMKEYQNPTASIERKGVDMSGSTEIFANMVISNNRLTDNYLPFNSRKFAPIVPGKLPLKEVMSEQEIATLSNKLGEIPDQMDVRYVAQIAKWILAAGPKFTHKFRNLEYAGPMFWQIAHASMSRWQKVAVLALTTVNSRGPIPGWNEEKKAFLWSKAEEALRRKKEFDLGRVRMATVYPFFECYRDRQGRQVFEVEQILDGVVDDFWVKPIGGLERITGAIPLNRDSAKPVRPAGMSQFQWRKMKEELEAKRGKGNGKENNKEKETDLL